MKLSIIIVSFNTEKLTISCLKSIKKFAPKFSYEIIVVDNGSNDKSITEIKKLNYKETKIIENGANFGFSKANNIGIKASSGKYKLLLNSDTILINDVFSDLVEFAEKTPDAGVVAPKLLNKDETMQPSIFHFPTIKRAIAQFWLKKSNELDKYGLTTHDPVMVDAVVGACFLITPEALSEVGLLDEKFFMYFEDIDYCKRANELGLKIYYLPCSYLIHIHGASGNNGVSELLVDSSKKYFGIVRYYLYTFILWSGQKMQKIFR